MPIASALMDAIKSLRMILGAFSGYLRSIRCMMCTCHSFANVLNCSKCTAKDYRERDAKVYKRYIVCVVTANPAHELGRLPQSVGGRPVSDTISTCTFLWYWWIAQVRKQFPCLITRPQSVVISSFLGL